MKKKLTSVEFTDNPQLRAQLDEVIEQHKGEGGALMPIMQKAQEIYGYLPPEVQKHIAIKMGIPVSEVFGVATFYSQFLLNPKGQHLVSLVLGSACYLKGSGLLMERLESELGISGDGVTDDGKFSLEATRCIGACGLAPVLTVGEDVYGRLTPDDIPGIIAKYRD